MQLEAALASKEAPLALCAWRMEQREKRPLREQVRDTVEVCLEAAAEKFGENMENLVKMLGQIGQKILERKPSLAGTLWFMFLKKKRTSKPEAWYVFRQVEKASMMDAQRRLKECIKKTQARSDPRIQWMPCSADACQYHFIVFKYGFYIISSPGINRKSESLSKKFKVQTSMFKILRDMRKDHVPLPMSLVV